MLPPAPEPAAATAPESAKPAATTTKAITPIRG
jgi:hypothetical protein